MPTFRPVLTLNNKRQLLIMRINDKAVVKYIARISHACFTANNKVLDTYSKDSAVSFDVYM